MRSKRQFYRNQPDFFGFRDPIASMNLDPPFDARMSAFYATGPTDTIPDNPILPLPFIESSSS